MNMNLSVSKSEMEMLDNGMALLIASMRRRINAETKSDLKEIYIKYEKEMIFLQNKLYNVAFPVVQGK